MALSAMLAVGGFEVAMVFAVRPAFNAGSEAATRAAQFLGLFSGVLLSLGLLPQYIEIWRRREVVGISLLLLVLDMLGGRCSCCNISDNTPIFFRYIYELVTRVQGPVRCGRGDNIFFDCGESIIFFRPADMTG
jgi:hypothetical protein